MLLIADESDMDARLDIFIAQQVDALSRSYVQTLIKNGGIKVNGRARQASYRVRCGDSVTVDIPEAVPIEPGPENIPLKIVYEDTDIAVIDKPKHMVVHPAPGNITGTLVNALLFHLDTLSGINGQLRPGIIHRLDKDTSGLLVVAKTDAAHRELSAALQNREIQRIYHALAAGNIKTDTGIIDAPIGRHPKDRKRMAVVANGREACTHYRVLRRFGNATLVQLSLQTGRTHQIRVHLQSIGHGVLGDSVYGAQNAGLPLSSQALHAVKLSFAHPVTGRAMSFQSPLPQEFKRALNILEKRVKN